MLRTPSAQLWLSCKQLALLPLWQQHPTTLLQLCIPAAPDPAAPPEPGLVQSHSVASCQR